MAFLDKNGVAQFWAAVKDRLAGAFDSVEFNVAEQAANLVSGDSIATAFGKLAKNYTSLVDQISNLSTNKFDKNKVVANYTTQGTGYALDASLGPAIKAKMDLADTLSARLNKVVDVQQGRLLSMGSWKDIAPNASVDLCSITIPADDTRVWIVIAHTESNVGGEGKYLAQLRCSDASHAYMYLTRTTASGGGGLITWGFVNPDDGDEPRTITLSCYGYNATTHKEVGRIYAFAIANTLYS